MIDPGPVAAFLGDVHLEVAARLRDLKLPEDSAEDDTAARRQSRDILVALGSQGWLGCVVPPEHAQNPAGPFDSRTLCLIRETLGYLSPLADAVFALQGLGSRPLVLAGTPEQQRRWLPAVARGEAMAAFAMTEPEAGSDVASVTTTAREIADGWRLEGMKTLISNAGLADFYVVFASFDPEQKSRGIGAYLVEAGAPGLHFVRPQVPSAPHPLGEVAFRDCAAELIGREGFKLGMRTLDALRVSVAAAACGMAARALHEARYYAVRRRQFGKALAEFQLVQEKLSRMAIGLDAARLLTYRAAWKRDQGEAATLEVAMAKAFATETAQDVIDQAMQVCGGAGMLAGHPVERLYRAIRPLRIYEGTTEIQYLIIARELCKDVDAA
ncbi:MAG: acyl-CoA dehydrogenase family protein [Candidatus Eremiobacterota bacterium]